MSDIKALEILKTEANGYARKGDFSLALPLFEQLQVIEPNEPLWALRVGEILRRIGHPEEAAPSYRMAARLFADQREFVKAMASLKFVLLVEPDDKEAQDLLARLYEAETKLLDSQSRPIPAPGAAPPPATGGVSSGEVSQGSRPPPTPGSRRPPPPPQALALPAAGPARPPISPSPRNATPSLSMQQIAGSPGLAAGGSAGKAPARPGIVTVSLPADPFAGHSLRQRLPSMALFRGMPPEVMREVLGRSEIVTHPAGTVLAQEGDVGGPLFVIVDGTCGVTRQGLREPLAELGSGEIFGELSLITDDPRSATVTATSDAQVLALSREAMHDLVKRHPPILLRVLAIARDRMVDGVARTSTLFAHLDEEERDRLLGCFEFREIDQDGVLTEKDGKVDAMHVLLAGCVAVEGADGKPSALLGAGEVIGELSLLSGEPAFATTWASRKTWALALPEASFKEVVLSSPRLLAALAAHAASQAIHALRRETLSVA